MIARHVVATIKGDGVRIEFASAAGNILDRAQPILAFNLERTGIVGARADVPYSIARNNQCAFRHYEPVVLSAGAVIGKGFGVRKATLSGGFGVVKINRRDPVRHLAFGVFLHRLWQSLTAVCRPLRRRRDGDFPARIVNAWPGDLSFRLVTEESPLIGGAIQGMRAFGSQDLQRAVESHIEIEDPYGEGLWTTRGPRC